MERDDAYRRNYQAFALQPGEAVTHSWTASQGMLTLTNQRLLYEPMNTPKALIEPTASVLGQGALGKLISGVIDASGGLRKPWNHQVSDIATVEPDKKAHLRIGLRSGESHELEIAQSLWSPRFSTDNSRVRDEAVATIRAAMGGGVPGGSPIAPMAPAQSFFVGNWRVTGVPEQNDWGTLVLHPNGQFNGVFVMFGAVPQGSPVDGGWWLMSPQGALVIQGRVTQPDVNGTIVLPFQMWLAISHVSPTSIVGEWLDNENKPVTFARLG